MYFNQIDEKRRTANYVRISTAMQKTDRQVEELVAFAPWLEDTLKRIPTEKDIAVLLPENWQPMMTK